MENNNNEILMWFETKKGKKTRRIKQTLLAIAILYFLIGMPYIFMKFGSWDQCEESNLIKELEFVGIVSNKTLDRKNNYQQIIKIKQADKKITLNLTNEILKLKETGNSITWEKLSIHDSIKKEKGTFVIYHKREKSNKWDRIELAFPDCEKTKKLLPTANHTL